MITKIRSPTMIFVFRKLVRSFYNEKIYFYEIYNLKSR